MMQERKKLCQICRKVLVTVAWRHQMRVYCNNQTPKMVAKYSV